MHMFLSSKFNSSCIASLGVMQQKFNTTHIHKHNLTSVNESENWIVYSTNSFSLIGLPYIARRPVEGLFHL